MKIQKNNYGGCKSIKCLGVPLFAACYLLLATCLSAFSLLKDITVKSDPTKDVISISVNTKTKYNIFRISNPDRLVIDLNDCEHDASKKKNISMNTQLISKIRSGQFKNDPVKIARTVVELKKSVDYSAKGTGTDITVTITKKGETEKTADTKKDEHRKATATATASKKPKLEPVKDVKKGIEPNIPDKEHLALVKKIKQEEKEEKEKAKTAEEKKKPVVKAAVKSDKKEKPEKAKKTDTIDTTFSKDPITLDFTEADIKDVLHILGVKTGLNIIYSDDVEGTISIHLENVPFDEAMSLILQMQGLVLQKVASNVLRVMTPETLKKERTAAVQTTRIFRLSYADAAQFGTKIQSILKAEGQEVNIQTDERTNSLILTATPEGLLRAATLIEKLDIKPEQVLIEAKIVEIVLGDTFDIGIEWNMAKGSLGSGEDDDKIGIGSSDSDSVDYGANEESVREPASPLGKGVGVAAPSQGTVGGFAFGYLKDNLLLTARLAAAKQRGDARLLSQPRIATLNNQEASIMIGDQIPYTETTVTTSGSTQSTKFMNVGIQLTVKPTINADGRITMEIAPTVSYATRITSIGPEVSTRNASTKVLVKNGETIVIGGLITEQERHDMSQVPLLGDLPVLGHFFKNLHDDTRRNELLVFVTPNIMKE
ncbi:MAG: type IV pilus secretin PilQ [Elusimicrobia bacterium]|nr:type IV pilus secretin PilQ [Elusimicrobiota bacterium]